MAIFSIALVLTSFNPLLTMSCIKTMELSIALALNCATVIFPILNVMSSPSLYPNEPALPASPVSPVTPEEVS